MKWEEARWLYPNQYILLEELETHLEGDLKIIDEIAIIKAIKDSKEATRELTAAKPQTMVYHTSKETIYVRILQRPGFWGAK